jgi:hypothetical protein
MVCDAKQLVSEGSQEEAATMKRRAFVTFIGSVAVALARADQVIE